MLSQVHSVIIDCAIDAPGHGKGEVDGFNAVDKRFLTQCMMRLLQGDTDDDSKFLCPYTVTDAGVYSFVMSVTGYCHILAVFKDH